MAKGSCLCGNVEFEIDGPLPAATACHCGQCRKQSGHFWASASVPRERLRLTRDRGLGWYRASDIAQRGFCKGCGSFLFWKRDGADTISFSMGALATPTGTALGRHIFVADKGDYYDITDDLPQS